jgi:hypothetical protein
VLLFLPSGSSVVVTQNRSTNSTSIYISPSQAQELVDSSLSNYSTYDIFNPEAPLNVSFLVSLVPNLYDNVSSGWLTYAAGSNATQNASMEYIVMTTNNPSAIAEGLGPVVANFSTGMTPISVVPGFQNGLNYTYGSYKNSTSTFQALYGWKGKNVVLTLVSGNSGFFANESQLIGIVANVTPLN